MTQANSSVASFKDRLSRIAHEARDPAEELEVSQSLGAAVAAEDTPASGRRSSHRPSRSPPRIGSPVANGTEPGYPDEGTDDQSPIRTPRRTSQVNSHSTGNHSLKGNSRQDGFSNGGVQFFQYDNIQQKMELKSSSQANVKEHTSMLEVNLRSLLAVQASLETEVKQLKGQLDNECASATTIKLKLQEEQRLNESSQRELHNLKTDKERISVEMRELHRELNEKISELKRLQVELDRRNVEETNQSFVNMKNTIATLETENAKLKIEKDELEGMKLCMKNAPEKLDADDLDYPNRKSSKLNETIEETTLSIRQLEDTLRETCKERNKALQELARLRQHLLEKINTAYADALWNWIVHSSEEFADSDKMNEDSKTIEELKANSEYQRAQILQLEKDLRQEVAKKEDIKKIKSDEIQRSSEVIDRLSKKLGDCMITVDSKNVELLNLQTALGQYYAEIETKEHLGRDLAMAREELAKITESLKVANQGVEAFKREKENIAAKFSQAERMLSAGKVSMQKLEDDNSKLRHALEHSMTTLNRMSLDSDNYVDRRIVIKLLVTYFQRNHSKEVLDLMARMLGFSEEDRQRIGFAQHAAGKGVVRGVLGLPGRLVGGILGAGSHEEASKLPSENQSFADLWVDFLLKENEERERREFSEVARMPSSAQDKGARTSASSDLDHRANLPSTSGFPNADFSADETASLLARQNQLLEHSDSEFSTVPLTSSHSSSERGSSLKLPPR